ncbi:hypothetical protein [Halogeometricum luteum]|uniref:hypothetical protein n=1 Tax=Halogeometricum luteum TaxID=2950537 RepID=UPI003CCCDEE1
MTATTTSTSTCWGSATTQQVTRVNDAAWRSFFETVEEPDQEVNPPGYWGNQADGRDELTDLEDEMWELTTKVSESIPSETEYSAARNDWWPFW